MYKIREFTISFAYVDDESRPFLEAITDFANSIKYPARLQPRRIDIQMNRETLDARTLEEIEADRIETEKLWDMDDDDV